ncbi:MAG: hypothetical protein ACYTAN_17750 [Planctomycetota bacterium]|jgi:hypothetical protein
MKGTEFFEMWKLEIRDGYLFPALAGNLSGELAVRTGLNWHDDGLK